MILVTGASGLVGSAVAREVAGRTPVRVAVRREGVAAPRGSERVRLDFHDPSTFDAALRGVSRVFLLRPPRLARARRDFGPFIVAMRSAGVRHVAFLSVRGADHNPLLPHRRIERLLERAGLACTFLRPNDFMQNFLTVHRADIIDRGEIWAPAGQGRTSFVDVDDVAAAAARVLTEPGHAGRAYTLTGPEALDMTEVAARLSGLLGRRVTYRNPGIVRFLLHLRAGNRLDARGLVMAGVYSVARLGLAAGTSPDLGQLLGRPPTPFDVFIRNNLSGWLPELAKDLGGPATRS